jgi:site-specific recombinase XerC
MPKLKPSNKTEYQIKMVMKYNRDGSPDHQVQRHQKLMHMVKDLQSLGYGKRWNVHQINDKEVGRLVHLWRQNGNSNRTIQNKMVEIRWLATKVGRIEYIPTNNKLGILEPRLRINKAVTVDYNKINQLAEREKLITLMRVEFGLRTEEALKFNHTFATKDSDIKISLKGSWCKGGRPREISITSSKQVKLLELVKTFQNGHNDKSMIPHDKKFKGYYRTYNRIKADLDVKGHEYRHAWAQSRFEQVSDGLKSPHAGGAKYSELSPEEKQRWDMAAGVVNQELGHGKDRQDITATYIGAKS